MKIISRFAMLVMILVLPTGAATASDETELRVMLDGFLAAADTVDAHQTFWSDDLIYTSSAGARFGKAEIVAGFESSEVESDVAETAYSAEDVDVRVFGDTAVVTFKLVGRPLGNEDAVTQYYFNTGVFRQRDDRWSAVTWQATKIPATE